MVAPSNAWHKIIEQMAGERIIDITNISMEKKFLGNTLQYGCEIAAVRFQ